MSRFNTRRMKDSIKFRGAILWNGDKDLILLLRQYRLVILKRIGIFINN